ncbi:iduronate 2-sulfatase-like [Diadema antillarum]|uniref:iduronate 2-sulfatase-like n=1 Tax=Diadema antillarum TaxID=105358 RepID=UPI003A857737
MSSATRDRMILSRYQYFVIPFILLLTRRGEASNSKPNVLFIVADDLRASLNCYGGPIISPNLDQLASQSAVFNNAFVQQAVCGPSRISFLTGRRPDTTKLYDFGFYWRTFAGNYTTLPQHFKENGYFTASVGKVFHPGVASNGTDDFPYSWSIPPYHASTEKYVYAKVCPSEDGKLHNNVVCPVNVSRMPEHSLPDLQTTERALEILANLSAARKNSSPDSPTWDSPFFLAVGFRKPHLNWKYPEEFRDLYPLESVEIAPNRQIPAKLPSVAWEDFFTARQRDDMKAMNLSFPYGLIPDDHHALMRQSYYAASTFVDYELGRVLQGLEEAGFANNTIISFVGDHGWQLGEHGEWCKYSNFEVATRVPLMVHVPGMTDTNYQRSKRKFPLRDPFELATKERREKSKLSSKIATKQKRQLKGDIGVAVEDLVELVDMFPSLSELAGLKVPPVCPPQPFKVDFCAEGNSFAPLVKAHSRQEIKQEFSRWKNATFSQYPRPGMTPSVYTDLPNLEIITVMGYSMLTEDYHYTEWVGFNGTTIKADWSDVKARELYIRGVDPLEDNNVADESEYKDLVKKLSQELQNGWRYSQPVLASRN